MLFNSDVLRFPTTLCLLLLCVLTARAESPHGLALFVEFQKLPSLRVMKRMESEVERLLGPKHAELTWRDVGENTGKDNFARLAVIRFQGACEAYSADSDTFGAAQPVLGSTVIVNGRILPFMDIQCDRVRGFLNSHPPGATEAAYGRALGQVVAHELYHVLLETGKHSLYGISKAAQSQRELGRVTNEFEPDVREKLLASIR